MATCIDCMGFGECDSCDGLGDCPDCDGTGKSSDPFGHVGIAGARGCAPSVAGMVAVPNAMAPEGMTFPIDI